MNSVSVIRVPVLGSLLVTVCGLVSLLWIWPWVIVSVLWGYVLIEVVRGLIDRLVILVLIGILWWIVIEIGVLNEGVGGDRTPVGLIIPVDDWTGPSIDGDRSRICLKLLTRVFLLCNYLLLISVPPFDAYKDNHSKENDPDNDWNYNAHEVWRRLLLWWCIWVIIGPAIPLVIAVGVGVGALAKHITAPLSTTQVLAAHGLYWIIEIIILKVKTINRNTIRKVLHPRCGQLVDVWCHIH